MVRMFWPVLLLSVVVFIFWSAGDGSYRYPCQDPANFGSVECLPPICEADGTCTELLIPKEPVCE
jgi:hypothetical protein